MAPPLTLENVYEAVKRVRDWREFGKRLLVISELDAIHRQHRHDVEACLKAVIEAFLREDLYQHSWRNVIDTLYKAGENHIAHNIIAYAEPVEGECVCVCVCVRACVRACACV